VTRPGSLRAAAAATGLALVLGAGAVAAAELRSGDGGGAATRAASSAAADRFGADGPGPEDRPDPALSGQPVPTLPPGDPGTGPDAPKDETGERPEHDDEPVTTVPESALVDAETVGALAGGTWAAEEPSDDPCAADAGPAATRSLALVSAGGRVLQTVTAHADAKAAKAAVPDTADRLAGCGFTNVGDPRLGEASAQLTRVSASGEEDVAVVIAAEGVSVVLVLTGTAAAPGVWESLADIGLGTSCAALAHGCH
jgi:hypothetical protein